MTPAGFHQDGSGSRSWSAARRRERWRAFLHDPFGVAAAAILTLLIAASVLAPLVAFHDPNTTDLSAVLAEPSAEHLLGTDSAGRDVWARLVYGGRVTFAAGTLAVLSAALIGVPAGLVAGYRRGRADTVLSAVASVVIAAPTMVILLAIRASFGPSLVVTMLALGALISPSFFRLVRSVAHGVRAEPYIDAAQVSGVPGPTIVRRHVLLAVRAPLIVQFVEVAGVAIAVQAGLEFLGLGDPLVPNWGAMLSEGFRNVYVAPTLLLWPATAIVLSVVSLAVLGNSLRDVLEPTHARGSDAPTAPADAAASASRSQPQERDDDALIALRDYSVTYPSAEAPSGRIAVVRGVDLRVGRAEIVGLVGESGSGKTQIALSAIGLLPPAAQVSGSYRIAGRELVASGGALSQRVAGAVRGRTVGFVPQEPMSNLDPNTTIGAQLARPLRTVTGLSRRAARTRVLDLLASVGLDDPERVARSYPWEISGGMAQRVLIAGALGAEPEVIVADEPTTALDVSVQAGILDLFHDIRADTGTAILVVTHDFGVVADICDRVIVLQHGTVVEQAPVRDILTGPRHPYTRALLDAHVGGHTPLTPISPPADTANTTEATR
ncbi:MAG: dipeptide/oligopeptide/nickel ABC transporter permease/ATP-binding protein [Microbacterium sp.]